MQAPADEEITRDQFNATLWQPLRAFLARWEGRIDVALPDGRLRLQVQPRRAKYLVPVYGVPDQDQGLRGRGDDVPVDGGARWTRNWRCCPRASTT